MCQDCGQTVLPVITVQGDPGTAGTNGIDGLWGGVCAWYQFSAANSSTDPGLGILNFDSGNLAAAAKLYISYEEQNGIDVTQFISTIGIPSNAIKALIRVTSKTNESLFQLFKVTGYTDHTTYAEFDVTNIGSSGASPYITGDDLLICPSLSGETAFQLQTIDIVADELSPGVGINYPAALQGDVFRAVSTGKIGTTTGAQYPNHDYLFTNDLLYCLADTAGGDQTTAGASFFVFSAPRGLVPSDDTLGNSNFILNTDGYSDNRADASSNTNISVGHLNVLSSAETNVVIGAGDGSSGNSIDGSRENLVVGQRHILVASNNNLVSGQVANLNDTTGNIVGGSSAVLDNADYNIIGGTSNRADADSVANLMIGSASHITNSENNIIGGYSNGGSSAIEGDNNIVAGSSNSVEGGNSLVVGASNEVGPSFPGASMNVIVGGAGAYAETKSSLYLGGTSSPATFSGAGSFQTQITPLCGFVSNVVSPLSTPLTFAVEPFGGANSTINIPQDSVVYFEANLVAVQTAVGAAHTNTSSASAGAHDMVGFQVQGTVKNDNGVISFINVKWLDVRGRWIVGQQALPHMRRFISQADGTQSDVSVAQALVTSSGTSLRFQMYFPGFQSVMPASGITEPAFGELAATVGLTGDAVTTGALAAPAIATTYRYPLVDIYGGSGLYGGSGTGALGTATLTGTTIANNLYICAGGTGYSNGNLIFTGGGGAGATGTYTTTGGVVTGVTLTGAGAGYTTAPIIGFSAGGVNANVTAYLTPATAGTVTITAGGAGYTAVPNVNVYDGGSVTCGSGNGGSFRGVGTIYMSQVKF